MKKPIIIFFICSFLLTSCYSTKKLIRKSEYTTSDFNKNKIDGLYSNDSNDSRGFVLWRTLRESYKLDFYKLDLDNSIVKLELVDDQNLSVKLLKEDKVIDEFYLKGKIKGDYFSINRKLIFIPFFPICYIHNETKTIIGNDKLGNLVVVDGFIGEGHLLIMAAGSRRISSSKYQRIKTKQKTYN
jgi:hypothetical protein